MTSGLEHRECVEALPAYALGALPEFEAARVQRHLGECRECRADLEWLRAGVEVLPGSAPPIDPPPELKRRLMAVVESEAELLRAAGASADQPQDARRRWPWSSGWMPRVAAAVAAVCLVVVAVVLGVSSESPGTRTIAAQTTIPGARASVQIRGTHAELVVTGLSLPSADHVDEIWVKRGSAPAAAAGTFVLTSGSVAVGQPVRRGDVVLVTVEPGAGTSAPTTSSVITARV